MSQRFYGIIPGQLANILNVDGQRLLADHVNSEDGITLVYDVGQLVQGQFFESAIRTAFIDLTAGTPNQAQTIESLPLTYVIQTLQVSVQSITNLAAITVSAFGWGAIDPGSGASPGGDILLWRWAAGDASFARPPAWETVNTQAVILVPSFVAQLPIIQRNTGGHTSNFNQHVRGIELHAQSTTAVDLQVILSCGIAFWSAPVGPPRSITLCPGF